MASFDEFSETIALNILLDVNAIEFLINMNPGQKVSS